MATIHGFAKNSNFDRPKATTNSMSYLSSFYKYYSIRCFDYKEFKRKYKTFLPTITKYYCSGCKNLQMEILLVDSCNSSYSLPLAPQNFLFPYVSGDQCESYATLVTAHFHYKLSDCFDLY